MRVTGEYPPHKPNYLTLNKKYADAFENAKTPEDREAAQLVVSTIILHEFVHYGDERKGDADYPGEEGNLFEQAVLGIDEMHQNILGFTVEETMNNAKNIIKESKLKKQNSAQEKGRY